MSLINDLLRNLEKNKSTSVDHNKALNGLKVAYYPKKTNVLSWVLFSIILILLFVLGVGLFYFYRYPFHKVVAEKKAQAVLPAPTTTVATHPIVTPAAQTTPTQPVPAAAVDVHPSAPEVVSDTTQWYNNAKNLADSGNSQQAIAVLDKPALLQSNNAKAIHYLASLYIDEGSYEEAQRVIQNAFYRMPNNILLRKSYAYILFQLGEYKNALSTLAYLSPALKTHQDYYSLMAQVYIKLEKYEMAVQLYRQLLVSDPTNGRYWLGLAIGLQQEGKSDLAMQAYTSALKSNNVSPPVIAYINSQLNQLNSVQTGDSTYQ